MNHLARREWSELRPSTDIESYYMLAYGLEEHKSTVECSTGTTTTRNKTKAEFVKAIREKGEAFFLEAP